MNKEELLKLKNFIVKFKDKDLALAEKVYSLLGQHFNAKFLCGEPSSIVFNCKGESGFYGFVLENGKHLLMNPLPGPQIISAEDFVNILTKEDMYFITSLQENIHGQKFIDTLSSRRISYPSYADALSAVMAKMEEVGNTALTLSIVKVEAQVVKRATYSVEVQSNA